MRILDKCLFVVGTCAVAFAVHGAEWLGTGGDTLWGNADNWQSSTGVPTGNIAISATAGDNRTVTLDGDHEFSGTFNVTTGTQEAPVVFNATAEAVAATNHVKQTSSNGFDVKSGGVLKIESGVYDWANDYRVSDNSILWMTGGRMTTMYWGVISGTAQIIMEGGELVSGWRDGQEKDNGRLNLNGGTSIVQTGGRIRCANNTNKNNDAEALTIGDTAGTTSVSVSGGEISASGKIHLGKASGSVSTLSVSGTGVVSCSNDMRLGYGGANSTLTIAGNGQVNVGTTSTVRYLYFDTGTGTINLNGGTLQVARITVSSTTTGTINFNGGTLKPEASDASFLAASDYVTANVREGGAVIDTDYGVTISAPLLSGVEAGETDGGLVKKGRGILALNGSNTYTGDTIVEDGVLAMPFNSSLYGNLLVKKHAALAFDLTGAELEESAEITLLNFEEGKGISFEAEGDSVKTAVVLYGPVVTANVFYDTTTRSIKATIVDMTNSSETRKITSWNGGNDGLPSPADWHVDNETHWSNGIPSGRYDIAIVPGDAKIFYYQGKWGDGGGKFGDLIIRNGTTFICKSDGDPVFKSLHVGGIGTLKSSHVGLNTNSDNDMVIDETVNFEVSCEGSTSDTWITANDGYAVTFNGDVVATNGHLRSYKHAIFNGDVLITYKGVTHQLAETGTSTLNGSLIVGGGATVNLTSNLMLGENAKLVYGGDATLSGTALVWPNVEVEGGVRAYTDLAATSGANYSLTGGRLVMTAADVAKTTGITNVVVSGGTLVVDGSAGEYSEGSTIILNAVTFSGVDAADVVSVVGSEFDWTISTDGDTITATARDPSDATNYWIGGASGNWTEISNWRFGVPNENLEAAFTNDVVVAMNENNKNYKKLILNTDSVAFVRGTGGEKFHVGGIEGWGTLTLNNLGLGQINNSEVTITNDIVFSGTAVSWLGDYNYGGALYMKGNLSGGAPCEFWNNVKLYGNNSGLTGSATVRQATYFMRAESGSSNASWTVYADLRFDFDGTISFGRFTNSGQKMYYCNHEKAVTIEIGALGGESSFGNLAFFGDLVYETPNEKLANYTIKKVGDGKLTYASYGVPNIVVEEGELALAPTQYNDDHGIIGFDSIVVRSGAILSGTTANEDKPAATQTISVLTFAPGAILAPTVTYTAGEPASWTVSTITASEVSLQDMIVRLDAGSIAALANIPDEKPMVLSATTLNGKPNRVAQDANGDSIAADGSNIWLVRRGASGVVLSAGKENPGFILIVQ